MNVSQVLDLVAAGESDRVEFKRELDRAERLARELVALANRQGGTVLVGIEDTGDVCGVTVESMRYGVQATRNPTIVRYLRAYGYWEGDGLGVPRMIRLCRENGIREPDIALVGDEVVVTLYSRRYDEFHGGTADG